MTYPRTELEYLDPRGGYQPGDVPDLPLCEQTPCTSPAEPTHSGAVGLCLLACLLAWGVIVAAIYLIGF